MKAGKSIGAVAKKLGLIDQILRNWVKAAGKLAGAGGKVVTQEQMERSRLRAENVRLKRECETLKKATALRQAQDRPSQAKPSFARDTL